MTMNTSLRGVNAAGAEWAYTPGTAPREGRDYLWVSHQDIDYLAAKGVALLRLVFSWEILQPRLNTSFASAYAASLMDRLAYATGKGITVMIEPHGGDFSRFARYKGQVIGSAAVPNAAFADLWRRLAQALQDNSRVVFGLMNEPNAISTMQWFAAAQAAIDAIRATGAAQMIMVPGNGFSQPGTWNETWYDTAAAPKVSNADGWATLHDPLNNSVVSVHTYFDADGGGGGDDIADPDILAQRLQPVVEWARARSLKVHLSEFGANAGTVGAQQAVTNALDYLDAQHDVIIGWCWWAYGPPEWWGGYHFTLCASGDYTVDDPKMAWLAPRFAGPAAVGMRPTSTTLRSPGATSYSSKKTVSAGEYSGVPAGIYALAVAVRTSDGDDDQFCVQITIENTSLTVDVDWQRMAIDLRGHQLLKAWNCQVAGTAGLVTVTPTEQAKTVLAGNKTSFGLCVRRNRVKSKAHYQVSVKALAW